MYVLCIEGVHGVGKTFQLKNIKDIEILNEGLMERDYWKFHPQDFPNEFQWIAEWFKRIILCKKSNIILTDRSPFSAIFYTNNEYGKILKEPIKLYLKFLESKNIIIKTIYLSEDREIIWKRIQQRLIEEPCRKLYKEDDRNWFDKIYDYYEKFDCWDYIIKKDHEEEIKNIISMYKKKI